MWFPECGGSGCRCPPICECKSTAQYEFLKNPDLATFTGSFKSKLGKALRAPSRLHMQHTNLFYISCGCPLMVVLFLLLHITFCLLMCALNPSGDGFWT
ncbi:hypothetical protein CY34DRAFT_398767 [Suillus luteus UH-Slu-Lm8-n1]|uniref:Uncharacterized protein n=1 Tax=Suillus luteus UH-Slu-Lm8-n1 TaxID=930992 RepID=A0A0D0AV82_9AGAM|nr:hypothetical protein CY34DRAFT_398767 [Suillus luteus UH-Slu-Lm8-n1]